MQAQRKDPRSGRDAGFSLVELLIYMGLLVLVVSVAGGLLITGLKTQETTQAVTTAATTAQQIARSVQAGVRNASAVTVTSDNPAWPAGAQLLAARTIGTDPLSTASSCQAWYFTGPGVDGSGAIYTKRTTPAAVITVPGGGPQGVWTLLGAGVRPADPVTARVFNAPSGSRVDLKFNVAAGTHPYVLINTTTYTPQIATVSTPCF